MRDASASGPQVCRRSLTNAPSASAAAAAAPRVSEPRPGVDLSALSILLKQGANPMVCCDSGKNVLHDMFWVAKPPPREVLEAMEEVVRMLREATGETTRPAARRGRARVALSLS